MEPLTIVAGILTALLGAVSTWAIALYRGMGKRIAALESAVKACQDHRVSDAAELGAMRATVSSQDAQLAQLRRELSIVKGAFPAVRIRANPAGIITHVSETSKLVLGYDPDALVGLSTEVLVPVELRERHRTGLAKRAADPVARSTVVEIREQQMLMASGGKVKVRIALSEHAVAGTKEFVVDITRID